MEARILLVGDYPELSTTRARILEEWQPATTTSRDALAAVTAQPYDLLILCHTVPDETASWLLELIDDLHPQPKVLTLYIERPRDQTGLSATTYEVDFLDPGGLRNCVATLLGEP